MARIDWHTRLSGLSASLPFSSRRPGSVYGKIAMQGMVSFAARSAARTMSSTESRSTPGIEATGARRPSLTNSGQIRSSVESTLSRTMRRAHSLRRLRRGRVARSSAGVALPGASTGVNRTRLSIGRPYLIAMVGSQREPFYPAGTGPASAAPVDAGMGVFYRSKPWISISPRINARFRPQRGPLPAAR